MPTDESLDTSNVGEKKASKHTTSPRLRVRLFPKYLPMVLLLELSQWHICKTINRQNLKTIEVLEEFFMVPFSAPLTSNGKPLVLINLIRQLTGIYIYEVQMQGFQRYVFCHAAVRGTR